MKLVWAIKSGLNITLVPVIVKDGSFQSYIIDALICQKHFNVRPTAPYNNLLLHSSYTVYFTFCM